MLKNILVLAILVTMNLNANCEESVIIGHYQVTETISPGIFYCDSQELNCEKPQ